MLLPTLVELDEQAHVVILGKVPERAALEKQVRLLGIEGRASLPGFTDNPWCWMACTDALVMPSRAEGLPNAALEPVDCSTRVISIGQPRGFQENTCDDSAGVPVPDGIATSIW